MEVLDRLVDGELAVAVLDDHPAVDDVDLRDPVEVDAALVAQLAQDERLVVEALRAHEGDGEHDRSTRWAPVGQRRACMARMPWISHGVPTTAMRGLGGSLYCGQVELGRAPWSGCRSCPTAARTSSGVVAMVATPFHGSSGSSLGLDTRAPSISPAASSAISSALTAPPSWASSLRRAGAHGVATRPPRPSPSAGGPPVIFQ